MTRSYPERPVVGVLAAVRRGARVLLLKRAQGADTGKWGFPGGELELGESVTECAARELAEETGVVGDPREILTAFDYIDRDENGRVHFHFALICVLLDWRSGEGALLEPDQHAGIGWFTPDEVQERQMPASRRAVELMRLALAPR